MTLPITAPGVLANDADVDGDTIEADLVDDVEHGTLTLAADGSFTYEPAVDFHGSDAFTYTIGDGSASPTGPVTVTITVDPANDAPVVTDESHVVDEDTTLTVSAPGVLSGDTDIDGDSLLASLGLVLPTLGTATVNPDGSFSYVPDGERQRNRLLRVLRQRRPRRAASPASVTVTIKPVNDAPTTADQSLSTPEDTAARHHACRRRTSTVIPPSFTVDTDPTDGDVTRRRHRLDATRPTPTSTARDSVTFLVTDGNGGSATVTVSITVTPGQRRSRGRRRELHRGRGRGARPSPSPICSTATPTPMATPWRSRRSTPRATARSRRRAA